MARRLTYNDSAPPTTFINASSSSASYNPAENDTYVSESESEQKNFRQKDPPDSESSSSSAPPNLFIQKQSSQQSAKKDVKQKRKRNDSESATLSNESSDYSEDNFKSPPFVPAKPDSEPHSSESSSESENEEVVEKDNEHNSGTQTKEVEYYEYEDSNNSLSKSEKTQNSEHSEAVNKVDEQNTSEKKSEKPSEKEVVEEIQSANKSEKGSEKEKAEEESSSSSSSSSEESESEVEIYTKTENRSESDEESSSSQPEEIATKTATKVSSSSTSSAEQSDSSSVKSKTKGENSVKEDSDSSSKKTRVKTIPSKETLQDDDQVVVKSRTVEQEDPDIPQKPRNKAGKYNRVDVSTLSPPKSTTKSDKEEEDELQYEAGPIRKRKSPKLRHRFMYESDSADEENNEKRKNRKRKSKFLNDSDDEDVVPRGAQKVDKYEQMRRGGRHIKKDQFDSSSDSSEGISSSQYENIKAKNEKRQNKREHPSESSSTSSQAHKKNKFLDDDDDFHDNYSMPLTKTQIYRKKLRNAQENIPAVSIKDEDVAFFDEVEEEEIPEPPPPPPEPEPVKKGQKNSPTLGMALKDRNRAALSPGKKQKEEEKQVEEVKPPEPAKEEEKSSESTQWIVQPASPFLCGDESSRAEDPFAYMDGIEWRHIPQKKRVVPKEEDDLSSGWYDKSRVIQLTRSPDRNEPYYVRTQMGRLVDIDEYNGKKKPVERKLPPFEEGKQQQQGEEAKKPRKKYVKRRPSQYTGLEIDTETGDSLLKKKSQVLTGGSTTTSEEINSEERRRRERLMRMRMKYSQFLDGDESMNGHGTRFMPNYDDDPDENPRLYRYQGKNKRIKKSPTRK